ncbi:MAG: hypothetical protein JXR45_16985, partial [Deltaproteobacteria bacterium]|nr:hypothetical protein [Deltaproteobacteria bacterium]
MKLLRTETSSIHSVLFSIFFYTLFFLLNANAGAVVPNVIPVGGMLADAEGQPLDGSYDVTFALYDVASGGTALWSETRSGADAVQVESGMFTVYLGEVSDDLDFSALMNASGLWLGMTVGTDSEMNRIYLGTVPYAM